RASGGWGEHRLPRPDRQTPRRVRRGMHVGEMHLDERLAGLRKRMLGRDADLGQPGRIDDESVDLRGLRVDELEDLAFEIRHEAGHLDPEPCAEVPAELLQFLDRADLAVDPAVPGAEVGHVRPVDHRDAVRRGPGPDASYGHTWCLPTNDPPPGGELVAVLR